MSDDVLHVAVGVVQNASGEVLLARRADHRHQGGLWEFPGGKIEPGESPMQALARELHEELGIDIESPEPLIRIPYRYPEHAVLLDVWQVKTFSGEPHGREGQPLCWVAVNKLPDYSMPAANRPIVSAARLPSVCMVTAEVQSGDDWLAQL
ncbi:MAG: 8-oxo-dGTP diphosphatase MutT, partial [Thiohalophilus sp.]